MFNKISKENKNAIEQNMLKDIRENISCQEQEDDREM